jgi:hypothetical protein
MHTTEVNLRLAEFVGRQDAEAIRASRDILDRGNEIREELEEF